MGEFLLLTSPMEMGRKEAYNLILKQGHNIEKGVQKLTKEALDIRDIVSKEIEAGRQILIY